MKLNLNLITEENFYSKSYLQIPENKLYKCNTLQCPFSENFGRSLLVGIKLEVVNTDTEITEYPVYWMATVVDVAGL